MKILFINASQNQAGNTSRMGKAFLKDKAFEQINLVDYKIYQINQHYSDDQFGKVLARLQKTDWIVLGTPAYWHDMSGYLKTLIERIGQDPELDTLAGKKLSVFIQGSNPADTIKPVTSIIKRFAHVAHMEYIDIQQNFTQH
ncbi:MULTISPECIES: flavodoxin family protein [unclassified Lactobacillus]|uniref:flavodoxin family protein n=1 Tax=unclassified Lactobacillus TaxID=2620435 RepID=UPI000EFA4FE8|nr:MULTISPECIES: NAD(P)H-dependent oxidoreductase [unclassified Lactobacillus]RMC23494.1 flavodoxin family protein [Lactobacillus sp. ESL0247]RMC27291.1 flavodoxin family protein [Lactobacillus sp. ESL0246]RMC30356.1 flavodoxin family protein [Lactobacillus sp. ESL0245]